MGVGLTCLSLGSGTILLKMVADRSACFVKIKQFIDHLMICLSRLPPAGKPIVSYHTKDTPFSMELAQFLTEKCHWRTAIQLLSAAVTAACRFVPYRLYLAVSILPAARNSVMRSVIFVWILVYHSKPRRHCIRQWLCLLQCFECSHPVVSINY
jgi:hypothetical protein